MGRSLYGRKRYDEFTRFLEWLGSTIEAEGIDTLLVAGDVFDTSTPSNRAQQLYYRFLGRVSGSSCRHIVIIAGNHDSPSFLNAPQELLRALNVYIVGSMTENPEDEIIVLRDEQERPLAIVCAVPYLRDRDIRTVEPGESIEDKNSKLSLGIEAHYRDVCAIAEQKRMEFQKAGHHSVPIVAMGHLFTVHGKTVEGDGVRELYVGSLAHVGKDVFPATIDYLALGHLHVPQRVAGMDHLRYCGSPIPMGYGEAKQDKKVMMVEFNGRSSAVKPLPVPCFQPLERISGSIDDIHRAIEQLKGKNSRAWLEIEYTGASIIGNLRETMEEALVDSAMEIRRIKNKQIMDRVFHAIHENETLDDLDVTDVFQRCLDTFDVPTEDRPQLIGAYQEIVHDLQEEDRNAE